MKNLILVFSIIAISAGAYAQTDSINRKMSPSDMIMNLNQHMQTNRIDNSNSDGVMMKNGKMMKVSNGQMTILNDYDMFVTMGNGTKIMSDGTYITNDGTSTMMKEGQFMDMSGNIITNISVKDKTKNINKNVQNNSVDKSNRNGVVMQNGKMMKVKNGQMVILQDNDVVMSNGTKIMSNGTYIKTDGSIAMMQEGQQMDMSGNMVTKKSIEDSNMNNSNK